MPWDWISFGPGESRMVFMGIAAPDNPTALRGEFVLAAKLVLEGNADDNGGDGEARVYFTNSSLVKVR